ncbi:MAG: vapL [Rhodocyclaceae bacterium]|nr:MAG: vapL [Rhodocyclaceae bacterium]TND06148.1 MAG: vapL [Rhodocyclaceae bacterium]
MATNLVVRNVDIDVSPRRISELVNGARPITADTALRLGLFFGMDPGSG